MLRALPAMVRTAASILAAVKSGILVLAICSNWARVTLPTFWVLGVLLPLVMPAALFNRIVAGNHHVKIHIACFHGFSKVIKPYNIRTTVISPGAIDTELPDSITESDIAESVKQFYQIAISAESFARAIAYAISQPEDVDINEILFRPTRQEL